MAFDKLTQTQLADAVIDGLINEDVMQTVMNANRDIDLELLSDCEKGSHSNSYAEWTIDAIDQASESDAQAALVDGQDITDNNSTFGVRHGNFTQTTGGRIVVSYEAEESDVIGRGAELSYQAMKVGIRFERIQQKVLYSNQASQKGNGDDTPGLSAGLEAQIGGEVLIPIGIAGDDGGWTGGGWTGDPGALVGTSDSTVQQVNSAGTITGGGLNKQNTSTKVIPAWTYSTVTPGALTETALRDSMQAIWQNTGRRGFSYKGYNAGDVNRLFSEYSFTSTSRTATEVSNSSDGKRTPLTAEGATNVFVSDFGILEMIPENQIPNPDSGSTSQTLFIIDPNYVECSSMWGWRGERQGKSGLSEKWQISSAYSLQVLDPQRLGMVQGIDPAAAMTFS